MSQLDDLVAVVRGVLRDAALGGYLHGSTATGRQQPTSDTDLLVVTTRAMTADERRALVAAIMPLSGRRATGGPARPVELTVVVQADVRPWRLPPFRDFRYGEWEREGYESGELPSRVADPDLAPLLTMVLASSVAVFGPPPAILLDTVPPEDLVRAVVGMVPGLRAEIEHDTRNVLLTLARILVTVETGQLVAKDEAAERVIPRLPAPCAAVLARSRDAYHGPDYGTFDDLARDIDPCVDTLVAAIDAAAASRGA